MASDNISDNISQPQRGADNVGGILGSVVGNVAVDIPGDADRGVPEVTRHDVDRYSSQQGRRRIRVPQGVIPTPDRPARSAATVTTRKRLRGSTGSPSSVVNTRPESSQRLPARRRSLV